MKTNVLKTIKSFFGQGRKNACCEFKSFIDLFKKKNVIEIILLGLFFSYLFLSNIFSRPPFNYIYNCIFVVFAILILIKLIKENKIVVNRFVAFWLLFIVITLPINFSLKIYSITPYVNCLNAIVLYIYIYSLSPDLKDIAIRFLYFALLCYFGAVIILCTKDLFIYHSFAKFYDYRTLGNLDGLSNLLALCFVISMYYFRKGEFSSLIISILLIVYIALSSRRTAFLIVLVGFFCVIDSFLKKLSLKTKILIWVGILALSISFMFLPFMSELRIRLLSSLNILNNKASSDGSSEARLGMIIRGYFYGISNLFRPYGFEQISNFVFEPSHDTFGDLAYAYGGLVAVVFCLGLVIGAVNLVRKENKYKYLRNCIGISFVFMFFLSAIFVTRTYCLLIGIFCGLDNAIPQKNAPNILVERKENEYVFEVKI